MTRPRIFWIRFDNPTRVFCNGQKVSGTVYIKNDEAIDTDGIYIKMKGNSFVRFNDNFDDEEYLDRRIRIFGNGSEVRLKSGEHSFPFCFVLPTEIPSTFIGEFGYVRYSVEATIKTGLFKFDYDVEIPVVVNCIKDLNKFPGLGTAVETKNTKQNCCFCCRAGPVRLRVSIQKSGFVPGETIFISAEIENRSASVISSTFAKLVQVCRYKTLINMHTSDVIIAQHEEGPVLPGKTFTWKEVPMLVPGLPPSGLDYCKMIDISYNILFEVKPGGMFSPDLEEEIRIVIGNVALNPNPFKRTPGSKSSHLNYELIPPSNALYPYAKSCEEMINDEKYFAWNKTA